MDRIFNADNKFFRGLNKLIDCVAVSFCFVLCNIPMIALLYLCIAANTYILMPLGFVCMLLTGPSFAALYYVTVKNLKNGHGYAWSEYWHGFAASFKQGFVSGLVVFGLTCMFLLDIYLLVKGLYGNFGFFCWLFVVLLFLVAMWSTFLFAYIARFEDKTAIVLKNAFILAFANLPKAFLCGVLLAVTVLLCIMVFPLVFLLPALYMWIKSALLEKIFRKYMSPEELAAEDEKNREFFN